MKCILLLLAAFSLFSSANAADRSILQIREVQFHLTRTDRNPGPIDGVWGKKTERALIDFLAEQQIEYDGELSDNELKLLRSARVGDKYSKRRYRANRRTMEQITLNNGLVKFKGRDELPQYLDPPPNDITLAYHYNSWLTQRDLRGKYVVEPTEEKVNFISKLKSSAFLDKQFIFSSMLSYLYYEDGKIVYDGIVPEERFRGLKISNNTELRSQSVGKSFVSYVVGHAICEGYIDSIDVKLNDWPLISDTLYAQRTLADVLNMRARDQHVVTEDDGFVKSGRWFNGKTTQELVKLELNGTKPNSRNIWNYNGLSTNIALNYVIFKTGDDWQSLLNRVFQDRVGIENRFFFQQHRQLAEDADGPGWYSAYASRYDYLRIAVAMLNDWQSDNCVGKYLKNIYKNRKGMNHGFDSPHRMSDVAKSYGGQFWFDFAGMKNRKLFGMNGNNGQNVLIDMERGRIVVLNAAHTNFDWRTLVYTAIRDGKLPD